MIFDSDIIRDVLRRAVLAAQRSENGFTESLALQIEQQVRQDWGGSEPYIAHGKESRLIERNDKIHALWDSGQRDVRMIASRFGLSTKQVRRIIGG